MLPGMTVAPRTAQELVEARLGEGPWQVRPFGAGRFSQTFSVTGPDRELVLRVAPPDDLRQLFYERRMMRQEPAIHARLLAETSIPVPEIVTHDFSRERIDRDWLLMPRLAGKPLSRASLDADAADRALRQWGGYIAEAHGLTDPGGRYGYLGEHACMEPQPTWRDAFAVMYRKELDDIVDCGVYDRATADECMRLLEDHLDVFEHRDAPRLLHGDIWVTNLLVAPDGTVTGVLDWDRACWGDVEWDLAIAEYCGVTRPAFWAGYGRQVDNHGGAAAVRRLFYLLYEHQKYIVISTSRRRSDAPGARRYAEESLAAMRRFRDTGEPVF
jgi:aminoglycoside phosphotransferase (APT) family kinase protein